MFASNISGARHTTAHYLRSFFHPFRQFGAQCRRIHRTQSCSIGWSCLQFHSLLMSLNSGQRHYNQPRNCRRKVYWRHFFCFAQTTSQRSNGRLLSSYCVESFTNSTRARNDSLKLLVFVHGIRVRSNYRQQCEVPIETVLARVA